MLTVILFLAILYCAAVIGWAAIGTNSNRKDR